MPPEIPSPTPPPPPPPTPAPPPPPPKKTPWLRYGCGALLALLLIIVATVAITLWWIQRPIKPVVLSASEKAKVEQKINYLENPAYPVTRPGESIQIAPSRPAPSQPPPTSAPGSQPQPYVPGSKVIRLTQREMNGLLNENTDLGKSVRLEFDRDAVNAYVAVRIPQDFPIGGGKMFRARARFGLSVDSQGQPYAGLEDVSVLGISLPNAWLGGIKGQNLLGDAMGDRRGGRRLRGIKNIHVEPGALVIELED